MHAAYGVRGSASRQISGLNLPGRMTFLLRTRVGELDRHLTVAMDKVELVPEGK